MTAKKLFMICLLLAGLFCLPAEAQHPGETVSPQTIRKLGEKHFFSLFEKCYFMLCGGIRQSSFLTKPFSA